jgi:hypothetical protein
MYVAFFLFQRELLTRRHQPPNYLMTLINNVSMPIFNNNKGKLELISETPFILENTSKIIVIVNSMT